MDPILESYRVIGLMSGTSLDGLDIAFCQFVKKHWGWEYHVRQATTIAYPQYLGRLLKKSVELGGLELAQLNVDLGVFMGIAVADFIKLHQISADFIASHGHTVFHQPEKSLTLQIGSPTQIAALANLPVVADFRTGDVALGGNGAPLVPIGDEILFSGFDVCLNLGGIANISYKMNDKRLACDVCPFNLVFNHLAQKLGHEYDDKGHLTAQGKTDSQLLEHLNALPYYHLSGPKSLGWEWVSSEMLSLIDKSDATIQDKLNTFCTHAVQQICNTLPPDPHNILVTGGGAFHEYFIKHLQEALPETIVQVPESGLVNFKEAMVFAFLGVLRWKNEINCLSSVTGAQRDSIGGAIYLG